MKEQLEAINENLAKLCEQGDRLLLANAAKQKGQDLSNELTTILHLVNTAKIQSESINVLLTMLNEQLSDS